MEPTIGVSGERAVVPFLSDSRSHTTAVPVYCVLVALWSVVTLEFWDRKDSEIAFQWSESCCCIGLDSET